ncbi:hypothetical protein [Glycomyces sp. NRRL B-16210]|uniref:hypothetical protein n=1 Tax=Glycomyces sp. NRRL B-16210 TaxID=1463821 RepID=UPI0004BFDBCF|nr:hypothetical protein [Glycomyces sp. NRRL B-16210]
MRKRILYMFAAMVAALSLAGAAAAPAVAVGSDDAADFTAEAIASGLTADQAADLQDRVDEVLEGIPGGTQISATEISYDGLDVTVDPLYTGSDFSTAAISCTYEYFCIEVRGTRFNFWECKTWALTDWWGLSPFNNNQTKDTVARAWDQYGNEVFRSVAPDSGVVNTVTWWSFRPC